MRPEMVFRMVVRRTHAAKKGEEWKKKKKLTRLRMVYRCVAERVAPTAILSANSSVLQ